MFENLGFFRSKFSIFAIGEYRKHGFIKVGEIISAIPEKSAFSTWPLIPFGQKIFAEMNPLTSNIQKVASA